jgi:IS4 transposase
MSFAQLTYRESLRGIEVCLKTIGSKLYHLGFRGNITRTNLANANESRNWMIYSDIAMSLISRARVLYQHDHGLDLELDKTIYAIDSSTIDLCLSLFPWAKFRKRKAAIKLHTIIDIKGSIPTFIHISDGSMHDVNVLDLISTEPDSIYIMDRGYLDFRRLYKINFADSFFVIRAKRNLKFQRVYSRKVDKEIGLCCDQTIILTGYYQSQYYPEKLRRVKYYDKETGRYFVFLTNNFEIEAIKIAELYKNRWKIELFFKWIKQHLRVKNFYGTSINAVKTQIWIAISTYVLVAIMKKEFKLSQSLYTILLILSVTIFEKVPINQLFNNTGKNNVNGCC